MYSHIVMVLMIAVFVYQTEGLGVQSIKCDLQRLGALTCRGELQHDRQEGLRLASLLEEEEVMLGQLEGTWDLAYTSSPFLFMSSPFFMAARAVCRTPEEADRFAWFCRKHRDALAFTSIGNVTQIITKGELVSEFESNVAAIPGLPVLIKGTIESRARVEVDKGDQTMTLLMDTVRIKQGTSNLPFVGGKGGLLDNFDGLKTSELSDMIGSIFPKYRRPSPQFRTYFLDDTMRISRNQDDDVFVYTRRD